MTNNTTNKKTVRDSLLDRMERLGLNKDKPTTREVQLITNEDYLEAYKQLKELWNDAEMPEEGYPKEYQEMVYQWVKREASIPITIRGESLSPNHIVDLSYFYQIMQLRERGIEWNEVLIDRVYPDKGGSSDCFIRVLEIETKRDIKTEEDLQKALGNKKIFKKGSKKSNDSLLLAMFFDALRYRLKTKIKSMIDRGAKWEDLIKISPKEAGLKELVSKEDYPEALNILILYAIGSYFKLSDYNINPFKPKYIIEALEAPREVEFKLKAIYEDNFNFEGMGTLEYLVKQDADLRFYKRNRGEEVLDDKLSK